eukprot:1149137-Pelagomonas_calceolata.AAC.3
MPAAAAYSSCLKQLLGSRFNCCTSQSDGRLSKPVGLFGEPPPDLRSKRRTNSVAGGGKVGVCKGTESKRCDDTGFHTALKTCMMSMCASAPPTGKTENATPP